jgi:hypothetical protein
MLLAASCSTQTADADRIAEVGADEEEVDEDEEGNEHEEEEEEEEEAEAEEDVEEGTSFSRKVDVEAAKPAVVASAIACRTVSVSERVCCSELPTGLPLDVTTGGGSQLRHCRRGRPRRRPSCVSHHAR